MATAKTRKRNPRGQGDRLRDGLLAAARDLLVEVGDQNKLSVRAITARAGVSHNALYLHFADKEALLSAVMIAGYKELRAFLNDAVSRHEEPLDQLRALGRAYLEFGAERPGIYRVLFMTKVREGVPMATPDAPSGLDEGVDTFNDLLAIVKRCLPNSPDPFTQAVYIWTALHGYVAFNLVLEAFPWPPASDYLDRMIEAHIEAHIDA